MRLEQQRVIQDEVVAKEGIEDADEEEDMVVAT